MKRKRCLPVGWRKHNLNNYGGKLRQFSYLAILAACVLFWLGSNAHAESFGPATAIRSQEIIAAQPSVTPPNGQPQTSGLRISFIPNQVSAYDGSDPCYAPFTEWQYTVEAENTGNLVTTITNIKSEFYDELGHVIGYSDNPIELHLQSASKVHAIICTTLGEDKTQGAMAIALDALDSDGHQVSASDIVTFIPSTPETTTSRNATFKFSPNTWNTETVSCAAYNLSMRFTINQSGQITGNWGYPYQSCSIYGCNCFPIQTYNTSWRVTGKYDFKQNGRGAYIILSKPGYNIISAITVTTVGPASLLIKLTGITANKQPLQSRICIHK
ncbi:MAG: hypothetical protein HQK56_02575 [Deltaproteobacteria bacterium]|nr:hypothetical protein [Deltaproteobacteria bacterium]